VKESEEVARGLQDGGKGVDSVTHEKGRIEIKLLKCKGKELFFPFIFDVS
jgi:hypothetical protein